MTVSYTSPVAIAAYLGVTFTPEQTTAAQQVADAVTLYVDRYTGRTWQDVSPAVRESCPVVPPIPGDRGRPARVFLRHVPVASVSNVVIRSTQPEALETPLSTDEYELLDPSNGVLALSTWFDPWYPDPLPGATFMSGWYSDALALVDYDYAGAIPADIALASTMIAAAEMARQIAVQSSSASIAAHPELAGLSSISVGRNDVAITRSSADAATVGGAAAGADLAPVGSTARTILDSYVRVVFA